MSVLAKKVDDILWLKHLKVIQIRIRQDRRAQLHTISILTCCHGPLLPGPQSGLDHRIWPFMLCYIPLKIEERSKEQLQNNQSSSGVVPHSIKEGENEAAELNVQKRWRWKGWRAHAFAGLVVAARDLAGGLVWGDVRHQPEHLS